MTTTGYYSTIAKVVGETAMKLIFNVYVALVAPIITLAMLFFFWLKYISLVLKGREECDNPKSDSQKKKYRWYVRMVKCQYLVMLILGYLIILCNPDGVHLPVNTTCALIIYLIWGAFGLWFLATASKQEHKNMLLYETLCIMFSSIQSKVIKENSLASSCIFVFMSSLIILYCFRQPLFVLISELFYE